MTSPPTVASPHTIDDLLAHADTRLRRGGLAGFAGQCQRCDLVTVCGAGHRAHRFSAENGCPNPSMCCADLADLIGHIQQSLPRWQARRATRTSLPADP
ncbi:MAG: hypothetical protein JXA67_22685 [Micromonosporaceae bacterium]|nr:hypothetical protein [Micromonosporaceae bacterium]